MDLCRKRGRMEADIERWLSFAVKVENKLQTMNNDTYSDRYIAGISNLLKELRHEAAIVKNASLLEKEDSYFRVNKLAQKLINTAHFAHHT